MKRHNVNELLETTQKGFTLLIQEIITNKQIRLIPEVEIINKMVLIKYYIDKQKETTQAVKNEQINLFTDISKRIMEIAGNVTIKMEKKENNRKLMILLDVKSLIAVNEEFNTIEIL